MKNKLTKKRNKRILKNITSALFNTCFPLVRKREIKVKHYKQDGKPARQYTRSLEYKTNYYERKLFEKEYCHRQGSVGEDQESITL